MSIFVSSVSPNDHLEQRMSPFLCYFFSYIVVRHLGLALQEVKTITGGVIKGYFCNLGCV